MNAPLNRRPRNEPIPLDPDWTAYLAKIDSDKRKQRWNAIVVVGAVWLCIAIGGYFAFQFLRVLG